MDEYGGAVEASAPLSCFSVAFNANKPTRRARGSSVCLLQIIRTVSTARCPRGTCKRNCPGGRSCALLLHGVGLAGRARQIIIFVRSKPFRRHDLVVLDWGRVPAVSACPHTCLTSDPNVPDPWCRCPGSWWQHLAKILHVLWWVNGAKRGFPFIN